MKPKAKIDFFIDNRFYSKGDEVKEQYEAIVKLNEKGFIEPLTYKQLQELKNMKEE